MVAPTVEQEYDFSNWEVAEEDESWGPLTQEQLVVAWDKLPDMKIDGQFVWPVATCTVGRNPVTGFYFAEGVYK